MRQTMSQLDLLVRAVHRRMVLWRVVEAMGLGLAGGCVLALILLLFVVSRGREPLETVGTILIFSAVSGGVWGMTRRPTRLSAATEIDRQFRLDDLVSTSLS